jgi:ubiquitin carboxyl-terminal hydrolase 7
VQHDVHEFIRVLLDKLEIKMKGTAAEGTINKLFVGKMKSYIKSVNIDYYEEVRIEEFYGSYTVFITIIHVINVRDTELDLSVKGMKNLQESFQDYIATETLAGENKFLTRGSGLQDAKKGVIFQSFPPVLHIRLKRFEYDIQRDAMVKVWGLLEIVGISL